MKRLGLAAVLVGILWVFLSLWPRTIESQWVTVVSASMTAQVTGPSTVVEVVLPDGRIERFEIGFSEGTAEAGDMLCVEMAESWTGYLAPGLVSNTGCANVGQPEGRLAD